MSEMPRVETMRQAITTDAAASHTDTAAPPRRGRMILRRAVIGAVLLAGTALAGVYGHDYWTVGRFQVSTDDAYVKADYTTVAPKVPGYLSEVLVEDNQTVQAGQVLARIDDRDLRTSLEQAHADVAAAIATVHNLEARISLQGAEIVQAQAAIEASEARLGFAREDAERYRALATTGALEVDRLRLLETQLTRLGREIEKLYAKLHPTDALRTIPGIGLALGPLVLGVLHEATRFAGLHQLRGFCGMFPRVNSSGGADKPGQAITQSGNNRIKRALYLAADAARRIDPGLAEVYWRLMVRKGHHHKQALCAVATRLVNRIGKVLRTGQAYELRDPEGMMITLAEGRAIVAERFTIPAEIRNARRRHHADAAPGLTGAVASTG